LTRKEEKARRKGISAFIAEKKKKNGKEGSSGFRRRGKGRFMVFVLFKKGGKKRKPFPKMSAETLKTTGVGKGGRENARGRFVGVLKEEKTVGVDSINVLWLPREKKKDFENRSRGKGGGGPVARERKRGLILFKENRLQGKKGKGPYRPRGNKLNPIERV